MEITATSLITFLIGVATGAAAQYFADKYTDKRRKQEANSASNELFRRMEAEMPKLIAEMKEDFSKEENSSYREFIVTRRSLLVRCPPQCLGYFEEDHPQVRNFVLILENNNLISSVNAEEPRRYRFAEDFVRWLQGRT